MISSSIWHTYSIFACFQIIESKTDGSVSSNVLNLVELAAPEGIESTSLLNFRNVIRDLQD